MMVLHGITIGWFPPTYALLASDESPYDKPLTVEEVSWIGSMLGIGGLVTIPICAFVTQVFGRKPMMLFLAFPQTMHWVIIYFSKNAFFMYAARFLVGVTGGVTFVTLPVYIAEISDPSIRGSLASTIVLNIGIGILMGNILGSFVAFRILPCILILFPLIYEVLIYFLPETPMFLLQTGMDEKAESSFYFYKNTSPDDAEAKAEFMIMKQQCADIGIAAKPNCSDFCNREFWKICGLIAMLLLTHQMSGNFAMLNYAMTIFSQLGSDINIHYCVIILGIAQLAGVVVTIIFIDQFGRRVLLLISLLGMILGECAIAGLRTFASKEFLQKNGWIGLGIMCFTMFICSCGVAPVPFVVIVELLPVKILSIGNSLSIASLNVLSFVALKAYPIELSELGLAVTMLISAGFCVFCAIVLGLKLPETNRKNLV
ncbi:hypothetical protein KR018_005542 [Drosophila ironensis]|nr:hypothetical protein KR018_005542 [Drosophila ironensis]